MALKGPLKKLFENKNWAKCLNYFKGEMFGQPRFRFQHLREILSLKLDMYIGIWNSV
jgi:hypothetical protein